ncbi:MAG: tRNA (adenine(22)-N(1))-methyltransferase TrmK [Planctomycetota bacterium]
MPATEAARLGPRLAAVQGLLDDGFGIVLDIGCDHGDLVVALGAAGRPAVGVELRPHLVAALRDRGAAAVLGDGFRCAAGGWLGGQQAVLAGLGEERILAILERDRERARRCRRVILCPSTRRGGLRPALATQGWRILDEDLVERAGRWYEVLAITTGTEPAQGAELLVGPRLIATRHPCLPAFLDAQLALPAATGSRAPAYRAWIDACRAVRARQASGRERRPV